MSWSNKYIGLPFKIGGRDVDEGVDCWGLLREVYRHELGIEVPSLHENYRGDRIPTQDDIDALLMVEEAANEWFRIEDESDRQEFDAVWLRIAGDECHVGIVLSGDLMLHSIRGAESCIVNLSSMGWNRRVVRCYRHSTLLN